MLHLLYTFTKVAKHMTTIRIHERILMTGPRFWAVMVIPLEGISWRIEDYSLTDSALGRLFYGGKGKAKERAKSRDRESIWDISLNFKARLLHPR